MSWYSQESTSYTVLDWLRERNTNAGPAGHTVLEATATAEAQPNAVIVMLI